MICIDNKENLLSQAQNLAHSHQLSVTTLCMDTEKSNDFRDFATRNEGKMDLIHVCRYLHRPLFPDLKKMIVVGGLIIYVTFMEGCDQVGACRPKNPKFILKKKELEQVFGPPYFEILCYEERKIEDGRPIQCVVSKKLE